jgi:uncharacterized protein (TIGR02145 family)
MENLLKMATLLAIAGLAAMFNGCNGSKSNESLTPVISSVKVSNITFTGATFTVTILGDGGSPITGQGITINNVKRYSSEAFGTKTITVSVTDLKSGTDYTVRGYAQNKVGDGYGDEVKFTTLAETTSDYDGNVYQVLTIGTQKWTKPNFHGTHYANGDPITYTTDNVAYGKLTTGAYRWYNDDPKNGQTYGALYNFYTGTDPRGLIKGFHTPTVLEYKTLVDFLGGYQLAGYAMLEPGTTHWTKTLPNIDNSSGFTVLPAGEFGFDDPSGKWISADMGTSTYFWTTVTVSGFGNTASANSLNLEFGYGIECTKDCGLSLRLVAN